MENAGRYLEQYREIDIYPFTNDEATAWKTNYDSSF